MDGLHTDLEATVGTSMAANIRIDRGNRVAKRCAVAAAVRGEAATNHYNDGTVHKTCNGRNSYSVICPCMSYKFSLVNSVDFRFLVKSHI